MATNKLYDEYSHYTSDARALDQATSNAIWDLFQTYRAAGYCPREISHVMQEAIRDIESQMVLGG